MLPVRMRRSSSASAAFETAGDRRTKTRLEIDYQQRFNLKKKVSYEQQVKIAMKRMNLGNPILREAKRRDKEAMLLDRSETDFARTKFQMRMWERNQMDREDAHSW